MQRRFWRISLKLIEILVMLWLVFVGGLIIAIHITGHERNAEVSDVIIVLGAGLNDDGSPGGALRRRSHVAAQLWRDGYATMIICTGGYTQTQSKSEADGCAEVLRAEGVEPDAIILENQSRSTEENALYSRQIMDVHHWETAIIVSDSFHMLRAGFIFTSRGHHISTYGVAATMLRKPYYAYQLGREVLALHWQVFKDGLNLPITYVP